MNLVEKMRKQIRTLTAENKTLKFQGMENKEKLLHEQGINLNFKMRKEIGIELI